MKLPEKHPNRLKRAVVILMCLLVTVAVGYFSFDKLNNQSTPKQSSPITVEKKSEKKFAAISQTPARIMIDKIKVDATIIPVGLTNDGMMDAPNSNELVGWYSQSARAGEDKYAMLLDGHYGTDSKPAVFRNLATLELGDSIQIQSDKGTILRYKVVETDQRYAEDVDMQKALYPYRKGVQSLTIITCEGLYDAKNVTYDKRTIVYAERVA